MKNAITFILLLTLLTNGYSQNCLRRPNINSFSTADQTELRDLIIQWLKIDDTGGSFPQRYPNVYHHVSHFNEIHHNSANPEIFITWHRYAIQELEQWLTSQGKSKYVPLPAWRPRSSPTDNLGSPIPSPFMEPAGLVFYNESYRLKNANPIVNVNAFLTASDKCTR